LDGRLDGFFDFHVLSSFRGAMNGCSGR